MKTQNRKWYGLKRGSDILLILSSSSGPIEKDYFYHHDIPIGPNKKDQVVELDLIVKKVIE